jgi:hypothetical protein
VCVILQGVEAASRVHLASLNTINEVLRQYMDLFMIVYLKNNMISIKHGSNI